MAKGKCEQVNECIWFVGRGPWGGGEPLSVPGGGNVYLLDGGSEAALIDAGSGPESPDIIDNIRAAGIDPAKVTKIFLTHAHCDHSGCAAFLKGVLGAQICAGTMTARALLDPDCPLIGGHMPFSRRAQMLIQVDKWLLDGQEIAVGDLTLKTMYTPGHVLDGVCYVTQMAGKKILFSGDTAIGNQPRKDNGTTTVVEGMLGWIDYHWSASLTTYIETLDALLALDCEVMLPGHGVASDKAAAADGIKKGQAHIRHILDDRGLFTLFAAER
ncbi:MAG: MBL fold metallo-hydrolase [Planctomycetes bacterium]|nr:MBL fold metallo-hydrolase [Planctomycetota bacterium]